jgi:hypothetical protein
MARLRRRLKFSDRKNAARKTDPSASGDLCLTAIQGSRAMSTPCQDHVPGQLSIPSNLPGRGAKAGTGKPFPDHLLDISPLEGRTTQRRQCAPMGTQGWQVKRQSDPLSAVKEAFLTAGPVKKSKVLLSTSPGLPCFPRIDNSTAYFIPLHHQQACPLTANRIKTKDISLDSSMSRKPAAAPSCATDAFQAHMTHTPSNRRFRFRGAMEFIICSS